MNPYKCAYERFVDITDKIVPDVKPYYKISNIGRVYSLYSNKIISNGIDSKGYYYVQLQTYHGPKACRIHRLVLMSFDYHEGCENEIINHIDGNKLNDDLFNLEWSTYSSNMYHAVSHGLITYDGRGSLSDEQVETICKYLTDINYSPTMIGQILNVSQDAIYSIYYRRAYLNISSKYTFPDRTNIKYSRILPLNKIEDICKAFQDTIPERSLMSSNDYISLCLNNADVDINKSTIRLAQRILYKQTNTEISNKYTF